jgi:hypothetical protein
MARSIEIPVNRYALCHSIAQKGESLRGVLGEPEHSRITAMRVRVNETIGLTCQAHCQIKSPLSPVGQAKKGMDWSFAGRHRQVPQLKPKDRGKDAHENRRQQERGSIFQTKPKTDSRYRALRSRAIRFTRKLPYENGPRVPVVCMRNPSSGGHTNRQKRWGQAAHSPWFRLSLNKNHI